jgi:predicted DNA-binding antitoxin AbrB/MazE fold protein
MSHAFRKPFVLITLAVLVLLSIIIFVGFQSSQEFEKRLELSIANAIIQDQLNLAKKGYRSPDGSIIIRIQPGAAGPESYSWHDTPPYISIWKYEKGILKPASSVDLEQVKRDGNAFVFVFMIQKIEESTKAFVDLATYYPNSDTPDFSAGGNASHWFFEYINQNWILKNKDTYLFWD